MNLSMRGPNPDGPDEEEAVRRLLSLAGARRPEESEDLDSVRAAAYSAWRAQYGVQRAEARRPFLRWLPLTAAAAALLIAALFLADRLPRSRGVAGPVALVATVEQVSGEANLEEGSRIRALAAGLSIADGGVVATAEATDSGPSRLALRLAAGGSLRLDSGTRLRFDDGRTIRLERGAVYFDSAGTSPERSGSALELVTAAGRFRDVGTQFELRVDGGASPGTARLRVREGRVAYTPGEVGAAEAAIVAARGEELSIAGGGVARSAVRPYGEEWAWVVASAPRLAIEGVRVQRFLEWLAREQGLTLELVGPEAARLAEETILHGSIDGLTLAEAPRAVLASCGLAHEVVGGALRVALRTAS